MIYSISYKIEIYLELSRHISLHKKIRNILLKVKALRKTVPDIHNYKQKEIDLLTIVTESFITSSQQFLEPLPNLNRKDPRYMLYHNL